MSQTVRYVLDIEAAAAEASVRKAADAISDAAKEAARLSAEAKAAESATRAFSGAEEALTQAERELAAKIIGTNAALEARAKALGVSTAHVAAMDAATRRKTAAEQAAAQESERLAFLADAEAAGVRQSSLAMMSAREQAAQLAQVKKNLGYQVGDVVQQVAAGQPVWRALSTQLLDVAFQFNTVTLASKLFSPAGAALAAIVAALGGTYAYLSVELTRAEEKMARQAAVAGQLGTAHAKLEDLTAQAASELALATGQTDKATEAAKEREAAIRSAAAAERAALDAMVQAADVDRQKARTQEETAAALAKVAQAEAMRERALVGLNAREAEAIQQTRDLAEYQRELADSNEELARRDRAAAEAAKARAAAEREKAEALRQAAAAAEEAARKDAFASAMQAIPGLANRDTGGQFAQMGAIEARMRAEIQAMSTRMPSTIQVVGAGAGQALTGVGKAAAAVADPLAAISAAGPQGAAIGAALKSLEAIGKEGPEMIVERLNGVAENIINGFASLPELVVMLLEKLPNLLAEALRAVLVGLVSPGSKTEKILTLGSQKDKSGGELPPGFESDGFSFRVGDQRYVNRTGMALVHEGERVVRSSGGGSPVTQRAARSGGSWGPPIIIQTAAVSPDALGGLADALGEGYDPDGWGRGTRPVFGG